MHGKLMTTRCTRCDRAPFRDTTAYAAGKAPVCGKCEALLRPHIVWFGESLPAGVMPKIEQFMTKAGKHLVFLAIGTSGLVFPAAGLVDFTKRLHAAQLAGEPRGAGERVDASITSCSGPAGVRAAAAVR